MKLIFALVVLASATSFAAPLAGRYKVVTKNCVLQYDTEERIDVMTDGLVQSLKNDYTQPVTFVPLLAAKIGDVIRRPEPQFAQMGALVDRQTASFAGESEFAFAQYLYKTGLTDAEGLAAGAFKTVSLKADATGVDYAESLSDGETSQCRLERLN